MLLKKLKKIIGVFFLGTAWHGPQHSMCRHDTYAGLGLSKKIRHGMKHIVGMARHNMSTHGSSHGWHGPLAISHSKVPIAIHFQQV